MTVASMSVALHRRRHVQADGVLIAPQTEA